jgi:hypothetical protein
MSRAVSVIFRARATAIAFMIAFSVMFDICIGLLFIPDLLEPVNLIGAAVSGAVTGWFFYAVGKGMQERNQS